MKWSRVELLKAKNQTISFDEDISFDESAFAKSNQIKSLQEVSVYGSLHYDTSCDRVFCDISVEGVMILPCSITLEDVEYDFFSQSNEVFAFEKTNDDEVHQAKGDVIELLPIVFQMILMEVPLKVVKEGMVEYPKGNGWEVVREVDMVKEEKPIDPRLAKLKDFKLEE